MNRLTYNAGFMDMYPLRGKNRKRKRRGRWEWRLSLRAQAYAGRWSGGPNWWGYRMCFKI